MNSYTAIDLLEFFTKVDGLQNRDDLQQFLVDETFLPSQLKGWPEALIKRVKGLHKSLMTTITYTEEEYRHLLPRTDSHSAKSLQTYKRNKNSIGVIRDNILKYFSNLDYPHTQNVSRTLSEAEHWRRQIQMRCGDTLNGLLQMQLADLEEVLLIVKKNKATIFENAFDLRVYVAASLVLCTHETENGRQVSHQDLAECSFRLYGAKELSYAVLEPYLFVTLLNWPGINPTLKPLLDAHQLNAALIKWKDAFRGRHSRKDKEWKKEPTLFFFGKDSETNAFVSSSTLGALEVSTNEKMNYSEFWKLAVVKNRLRSFIGRLKHGPEISTVELIFDHERRHGVEIPTSLPPEDPRLYNRCVSFFIGFTWSGPKAYGIDRAEPTVDAEAFGERLEEHNADFGGVETECHQTIRGPRCVVNASLKSGSDEQKSVSPIGESSFWTHSQHASSSTEQYRMSSQATTENEQRSREVCKGEIADGRSKRC
jgi:hypothetical protein